MRSGGCAHDRSACLSLHDGRWRGDRRAHCLPSHRPEACGRCSERQGLLPRRRSAHQVGQQDAGEATMRAGLDRDRRTGHPGRKNDGRHPTLGPRAAIGRDGGQWAARTARAVRRPSRGPGGERCGGGVSNVDIAGKNTLQIKAIGVTISTFETLPSAAIGCQRSDDGLSRLGKTT